MLRPLNAGSRGGDALHSARKAIRRFCLDCQGGYAPSVRDCADAACVFHPLRHGFRAQDRPGGTPPAEEPLPGLLPSLLPCDQPLASAPSGPLTPDRAAGPEQEEAGRPVRLIRLFCLVCAGNRQDVRACDAGQVCALWSFRFGVSPGTFKRVVARRRLWRSRLPLPGLPG